MMKLFVALIATVAMTQFAHANVFDVRDSSSNYNDDNGYITPGGPRPSPEPGPRPQPYPAPPGPGGGYPPPHQGPGPGYPPQPPYGRVDYMNCTSYNWNYQECYFSPYRVSGVALINQTSYDPCIYNQTYGIYQDRVWVSRGCSGTFQINHY